MDTTDQPYLNPWFSIWTKPRATIHQIIRLNPTHSVIVLAALGGFSQALDRASARSTGDDLSTFTIILLAMSLGAVGGIAGMYIYGALLNWTGNWLKGQAHREEIRAAIAWANVPIIWGLVLWIPQYALIGHELFTTDAPSLAASITTFTLFMILVVIELVISFWAFVVFLKCLGEVQGFSAWKALLNCALPFVVIGLPIALIVGLFIR